MYEQYIEKKNGHEFVDYGPQDGEVLLLLHGLFGTASNFDGVIRAFSSTHRVVLPVLPIFSMPLIEVSLRGLLKYLQRFVDFLNLKRFHIIGNSLGGHLGLMYILSCPEKVKSLVLTGSSGLYENAFGSSMPKRDSYEYVREKMKLTFFDSSLVTKEMVDEVFGIVNNRIKAIRIVKMAKSAIRHNMEKELYKINVPTCLIWGKQDTITPPFVAEKFCELIEDTTLEWIDECGHAPMLEHPDRFNVLLRKFYERQDIAKNMV